MDHLCLNFKMAAEVEIEKEKVKSIFADENIELQKIRQTGIPSENSKVLGIIWNTTTNHLGVVITHELLPTTRSELLSLL